MARSRAARRTGMTMFAADPAAAGRLRTDCSREMVVEVLWSAMGVRNSSTGRRDSAGGGLRQFGAPYVDSVAASIPTGPL